MAAAADGKHPKPAGRVSRFLSGGFQSGMKIQAQPDDHSAALTRAEGNVTGWLGSFPAISISLGVILAWAIGGFFVAGGFSNNTYHC